MTIQEFKDTLKELGFERKKTIGIWGYNDRLLPGNEIEMLLFTKGNFWIEKSEHRVFSGNYKTLDSEAFIRELIKVSNST